VQGWEGASVPNHQWYGGPGCVSASGNNSVNCWDKSKSIHQSEAGNGMRNGLKTDRYDSISSQAPMALGHREKVQRPGRETVGLERARSAESPFGGCEMVWPAARAAEVRRKRARRNMAGITG
jgi:hypothetical protein